MDIRTWFPLAIATTELSPPVEVTNAMLTELEPYISESEFQFRHGFAWTGDVNDCMDLHIRASFSWLRRRVEEETHKYVLALGGDMTRLQLYFQSSWPVLSRSAETVSPHTHMTASLSAVYYLKIPAGTGGTLIFENTQSPNGIVIGAQDMDLQPGSHSLSARDAKYKPREGRLIIFPARQSHSVKAHKNAQLRIAITFDIALIRRPGIHGEGHWVDENWDPFGESTNPDTDSNKAPH